jgi:addiction module HigA family antidote
MAKKLPPVHPGEILREEFLVPLKLTPYAVAAALNVPRTRIERIAREEKPVTADTALRLGKFFKTGAAFWMNIQARFDLETAEGALAPQIKKIAPTRRRESDAAVLFWMIGKWCPGAGSGKWHRTNAISRGAGGFRRIELPREFGAPPAPMQGPNRPDVGSKALRRSPYS